MPITLKCSHCLRKGVRSDQCPCQRKKTVPQNKPVKKPWQPKIETSILVFMYGKTIRAILNPYAQETLIGKSIAEFVKYESGAKATKMVFRQPGSLSLASSIRMELSTRQNNVKTVNGIISMTLPEKTMVLGMQAIDSLGFRFYVGGQEAKVRIQQVIPTITSNDRKADQSTSKGKQYNNQAVNIGKNRVHKQGSQHQEDRQQQSTSQRYDEDDEDEDKMSFLDEEEAQRIREWK